MLTFSWLPFVSVYRVFSDRLVDQADIEAFIGLLSEKLGSLFDLTYHSICPNKQPPIFGMYLPYLGFHKRVGA